MLEAAVSLGCELLVGLVSDRMADKGYLRPFAERKSGLERTLVSLGCTRFEVREIDAPFAPELAGYAPGSGLEEVRWIVVSDDTFRTAERLNEERERNGLVPLDIVSVPQVLAYDSLPISTRRILGGEIDVEGRKDLTVGVASTNPVKVSAVRTAFRRAFQDVDVSITKVPVGDEPGLPAQPREGETGECAVRRAEHALRMHDYGVGIEAGVFERDGDLFDVQYCAIVDRNGGLTSGHGPGFAYPPEVAYLVREEGLTVAEAFEVNYRVKGIGRREGAIGYMTKGRFTRRMLTLPAVYAALAPRLHRMSPVLRRSR